MFIIERDKSMANDADLFSLAPCGSSARNISVGTMEGGMKRVRWSIGAIGFLFLAAVALQADGWVWTDSLLQNARQNYGRVVLDSGQVLVCGGDYGTGMVYDECELYNPASETWTITGSLNNPRTGFAMIRVPNGNIVAVGGTNVYGGAVTAVNIYNPSTGTWSSGASMLTARKGHATVLLSNGKIMVAGGQAGGNLTSAELYDPTTDSWSYTGSMNTSRGGFPLVSLGNGKVLAVGSTTTALTSCELYDPASGTWSWTGSMSNQSVTGFSAIALSSSPSNTIVLRFGGLSTASEKYSSSSGTWSSTGAMNDQRRGFGVTKLANGNVFVAGGTTSVTPLSTTEEYLVSSGTWTTRASMAQSRINFGLVFLGSLGKVLAVAGNSGYGPLTSAELYTP
jgi:hypothetical protein